MAALASLAIRSGLTDSSNITEILTKMTVGKLKQGISFNNSALECRLLGAYPNCRKPSAQQRARFCHSEQTLLSFDKKLDARRGFEPRLTVSETVVLPLDDRAIRGVPLVPARPRVKRGLAHCGRCD